MDTTHEPLQPEDRAALCQLQQKADNLHQSSSNKFLVALEGLMLSAIAWESIDKPKPWLSKLSKVTTAIGLAITGIFTYTAIRDPVKANTAEKKVKQYGFDEFALPCEQRAHVKPHHVAMDRPHTKIHTKDAHVERLQDQAPQVAM